MLSKNKVNIDITDICDDSSFALFSLGWKDLRWLDINTFQLPPENQWELFLQKKDHDSFKIVRNGYILKSLHENFDIW